MEEDNVKWGWSDAQELEVISYFLCLFYCLCPNVQTHRQYMHNKNNNFKLLWSDCTMVLNGKLTVPGVLLIWIRVWQRPSAFAVGAVGVVWTFFSLIYHLAGPRSAIGRAPDS